MFVEHKEALEATEPTKTMKLSEAIRIGARMGPQCYSKYIDGNASCAFGAAALAMGGCHQLAGELHASMEPVEFFQKYGLTITRANDYGWTREQIADALEELGY